MKALKYLTYVGKPAGFVAALDTLPIVDPKLGIVIFAVASILKDTVNRINPVVEISLTRIRT